MYLSLPSFNRRQFCGLLLGVGAAAAGQAAELQTAPVVPNRPIGPLADTPTRLIALDPRFPRLFPSSPVILRVQTGSVWSEGPAWSHAGGYLVWSDIPNNRQLSWRENDGRVSVFRQPSNQTNGCTFDHQGRMITCEQIGHSVVRHETDGTKTVLASLVDGRRFNSPNDVAVHPDGAIWFTDPGYGGPDPLPQKEATYRIDPASGQVERVDHSLVKPNGVCFSPDFKQLYLADTGMSRPKALYVFDVVEGRRLVHKRPFAALEHQGLVASPDGQRPTSTATSGPVPDMVRMGSTGCTYSRPTAPASA